MYSGRWASVSLIASELKINTNQLFTWRKRFGDEALAGRTSPSQLRAVTVLDTSLAPAPAACVMSEVIVLGAGQAQLRLEARSTRPR